MKTKASSILWGNALEFYDFGLFTFLLPILSPILFPSSDPLISLTYGYIFLFIGFLTRPLGSLFFGYLGDHYGRKKALQLSIGLMTLATLIFGILPSYDSIGLFSFIGMVFCRLLQGFSAGGEYSGAGLFLIEQDKDTTNHVLKSSLLTASGLFGTAIAARCHYTVRPLVSAVGVANRLYYGRNFRDIYTPS